jgi:hypothetical protein
MNPSSLKNDLSSHVQSPPNSRKHTQACEGKLESCQSLYVLWCPYPYCYWLLWYHIKSQKQSISELNVFPWLSKHYNHPSLKEKKKYSPFLCMQHKSTILCLIYMFAINTWRGNIETLEKDMPRVIELH